MGILFLLKQENMLDYFLRWIVFACLSSNVLSNLVNEFDVSKLETSITYGDVIGTFVVTSKIDCTVRCSKDQSCKSVLFYPTGRTCSTNRQVAQVSGVACGPGCSSVNPVIYASKKTTMKVPCQGHADCVDPKSECRGNQCMCKPGYSFHGRILECVSSCSAYGNTFQPDQNKVLLYNNQREVQGLSLNACQSLCVSETSFVCRTIEMGDGWCILQDYTALDRPDLYQSVAGWNLYTRDCA